MIRGIIITMDEKIEGIQYTIKSEWLHGECPTTFPKVINIPSKCLQICSDGNISHVTNFNDTIGPYQADEELMSMYKNSNNNISSEQHNDAMKNLREKYSEKVQVSAQAVENIVSLMEKEEEINKILLEIKVQIKNACKTLF